MIDITTPSIEKTISRPRLFGIAGRFCSSFTSKQREVENIKSYHILYPALSIAIMVVPSAPEKISIKRRRIDEPIDHLLYQSKKQRTTDHIFVRLPLLEHGPTLQSPKQVTEPEPIAGIPSIRTTKPGDEVKDFQRYHASHASQLNGNEVTQSTKSSHHQRTDSVRRFHLTRDLSTTIRPESAVPLTPKSGIRPHLATFVERHDPNSVPIKEVYTKPPVDRIVQRHEDGDLQTVLDKNPTIDKTSQRQEISTFTQRDRELQDDDDLADELAALAMQLDEELDPEVKAAYLREQQVEREKRHAAVPAVQDTDLDMDDYVFETYVRIKTESGPTIMLDPTSQSFGYLVIDEDTEELWQQYLNDDNDSDDEWDEEDEDSNAEDNPRNDYPDDEVSSDDEFGRNAYRYRKYCSDDEQYDDED